MKSMTAAEINPNIESTGLFNLSIRYRLNVPIIKENIPPINRGKLFNLIGKYNISITTILKAINPIISGILLMILFFSLPVTLSSVSLEDLFSSSESNVLTVFLSLYSLSKFLNKCLKNR